VASEYNNTSKKTGLQQVAADSSGSDEEWCRWHRCNGVVEKRDGIDLIVY
jgi:hypothetical protein